MFRGHLQIAGARRGIFSRQGDTGDVLGYFCRNSSSLGNMAGNVSGRRRLVLNGCRNGVREIVDLVNDRADFGNSLDGAVRVGLNGLNLSAYVFGCMRSLLGKLLDLVCDDSKSLASFAGASRLDGGVQSKQVVCCAIEVITLTTWPISTLDAPSLAIVSFVDVATLTAS
jgi:hypothetical protein